MSIINRRSFISCSLTVSGSTHTHTHTDGRVNTLPLQAFAWWGDKETAVWPKALCRVVFFPNSEGTVVHMHHSDLVQAYRFSCPLGSLRSICYRGMDDHNLHAMPPPLPARQSPSTLFFAPFLHCCCACCSLFVAPSARCKLT